MGDSQGFLKIKRRDSEYRPVCERVKDYREVGILRKARYSQEQASRCMDCGTPFCHWGCPIGNYIPEWNDLVFAGLWEKAFQLLDATNNFPEITARLCPALCEYACVLGINDEPVTIKENELAIIEHAFKTGLVKPQLPNKRSDKKVAVIGSGPAGLACADELNKKGYRVTVFEKDALPGGILRYGIPDFKLEKWILGRRLAILEKEGIEFISGVNVGVDIGILELKKNFSAVCLAIGSRVPRDLKIEGRQLGGINFAMDYLIQSNKIVAGAKIPFDKLIDARNKRVVIIGGGDTGADCLGLAHRQGASYVIQIELLAQPPSCRIENFPWPKYPLLLKQSSSHQEGGERDWAVLTKRFSGQKGRIEKLDCVRVEFSKKDPKSCLVIQELPGSEFTVKADLVILALGFMHPEKQRLIESLNLELDSRGCVKTDDLFMTSAKGIFSAGDMHRGQSLVVWAIDEGRKAAGCIDQFLAG